MDDGPAELATAVEMCRRAAADGCSALVATPHQRHPSFPNEDGSRIREAFDRLVAAVGEELELFLGAEIHVDSELLSAVDELPDGHLFPLAGSSYLLVEFGFSYPSLEPESTVHELLVAGWRPILAHPEHIRYLGEDLERCTNLVAMGALLQVTAQSLLGGFGVVSRDTAWALVEAGLVHFVASDAHALDWRPPGLREVRDVLARRMGEELAERLTSDNPRRVLEDVAV